jgi:predicted MFS family arabinose efflux permease
VKAVQQGAPAATTRVGTARADSRAASGAFASLVVLSAITALNNVDRGLFALLLPEVQKSIPLDDATVGILLGPAFMVVYSIAGLPIAWLADRLNRRNLIALGLAVWSLVTAATSVARSALQLLLLRSALGLGEATNIAPTTALVSDLFPARQRALAFAVITVGTPLGTLLCFPLAGHLSATQGWRAAFVAMGGIGLVLACVALFLVREPRVAARGESEARAPMRSILRGLAAEAVRALRSRAFRSLVIAGAFFSCNYSAMAVWMPTFLARTHGLSVEDIGATLGVYRGAFGIFAALAGGVLISALARRDERWIAWVPALFCTLMVPSELVLLFSPVRSTWQAALGLETFFLTAANPGMFALLAQVTDARARAVWSACYFLTFNLLGQSLGPFSVGQLSKWLALSLGNDSLRGALLIAPVCIACAAVMLVGLAPHMKTTEEKPT